MFYTFPNTPCAACGQSHTLHQPYAAGLDRAVDCRFTCPVTAVAVGLPRPVCYEVVMELPVGTVVMESVSPAGPAPPSRLSHN
jgi:hypothetical protein